MIKMRNFLLYIMIIFGSISSVSAKCFFSNSCKVNFDKTLEQVQVRAELMDKEKTYQKRFTAKDKMGNIHTITIYDDEYMKIDNVFYAYKFRNLMHYGLTLNFIYYFATCIAMYILILTSLFLVLKMRSK